MSTVRVKDMLLVVMVVIAASMAAGCDGARDRDDSQERIDKTIEEIEEHAPGQRTLLMRLRAATPQSLKTPDLVPPARLVEQKRTVVMAVDWIERRPTVDAVMISRKASGYTTSQRMEEGFMSENRKAEQRGFVLFSYTAGWEPGSDEWAALKKEIESGGCEVVLMRDGEPVSNTVTLKYIAGPTLRESM